MWMALSSQEVPLGTSSFIIGLGSTSVESISVALFFLALLSIFSMSGSGTRNESNELNFI
jgi:hypothetical protein